MKGSYHGSDTCGIRRGEEERERRQNVVNSFASDSLQGPPQLLIECVTSGSEWKMRLETQEHRTQGHRTKEGTNFRVREARKSVIQAQRFL